MDFHHERKDCRLCGSLALQPVLSLQPTPPANAFAPTASAAVSQDRFPLRLSLCRECGHLQLVDVVSPDLLFRNYVYVSGTSATFVRHFDEYANAVSERTGLRRDALVVDIGSNDGTLLKAFRARGNPVLGVDPAREIAAKASAAGIETLPEFFTPALAAGIRRERGAAALVTANNVFAHIDSLGETARAIAGLLEDDGYFVFEVSYLGDVVRNMLFDTIYHEHLDYHSIAPLRRFFDRLGMTLVDVERVNTHGGSIRGYVQRGRRAARPGVGQLEAVEAEMGLARVSTYENLSARIARAGAELHGLVAGLVSAGHRIAAYGAPAKATTLMSQFGLDGAVVSYIVDDSPWKQGLYSPGFGIPVFGPERLREDPVDYLLVLAWNFAEQIVAKNREYSQSGGRFIIPLPDLVVRS